MEDLLLDHQLMEDLLMEDQLMWAQSSTDPEQEDAELDHEGGGWGRKITRLVNEQGTWA